MTWIAVLALGVVSFGLKALGPVMIGRRQVHPRLTEALDLLPIPMLAAIVTVGTLASGHQLQLDARVPGVGVAALLVWRRAPFLVVIAAAAATTALIRVV
jgi:branched-subunit amino acid transport protein